MNKSEFFEKLLAALAADVDGAVRASRDAAEYATNEESRAESKWDTQGLEASYLAAGQAAQARERASALEDLSAQKSHLLSPKQRVEVGALFSCDFDGSVEYFFFAGTAGGESVRMGEIKVTVITPQSSLAGRLRGLRAGDIFRLPNGSFAEVLTVA